MASLWYSDGSEKMSDDKLADDGGDDNKMSADDLADGD